MNILMPVQKAVEGEKIKRAIWHKEDYVIAKDGKLFFVSYGHVSFSYSPSIEDMLASDWQIV